jgi:hypothetical protein
MTIEQILEQRKIAEFLHFTTNRGMVGILSSRAVLSRERLPNESSLEHVLHINARYRAEAQAYFDKLENWLDFINLSISAVNSRFFRISRGWHQQAEVWWLVLSFDPVIATHQGVRFATTNNAYEHCMRGAGAAAFNELFKPVVRCKNDWSVTRRDRPDHLPTCEQAELLYPTSLSIDYLRKVYVQTDEQQDLVTAWLEEFRVPNVSVLVEPHTFQGIPN